MWGGGTVCPGAYGTLLGDGHDGGRARPGGHRQVDASCAARCAPRRSSSGNPSSRSPTSRTIRSPTPSTRPFAGAPADVAADVAAELSGRTLVVEDAHWADTGTLDVLALLVGRVPLVVTSRSALGLERDPAVALLEVPPLDDGAAADLARQLHPPLDLGVAGRDSSTWPAATPCCSISSSRTTSCRRRSSTPCARGSRPSPASRSSSSPSSPCTGPRSPARCSPPPVPPAWPTPAPSSSRVTRGVTLAHALLADADHRAGRRRRPGGASIGASPSCATTPTPPATCAAAGDEEAAAERAERAATTASPAERAQLLALAVDGPRPDGSDAVASRRRRRAHRRQPAGGRPRRSSARCPTPTRPPGPRPGGTGRRPPGWPGTRLAPTAAASRRWRSSRAPASRSRPGCSWSWPPSGCGRGSVTRRVIDDAERAWAAASAAGIGPRQGAQPHRADPGPQRPAGLGGALPGRGGDRPRGRRRRAGAGRDVLARQLLRLLRTAAEGDRAGGGDARRDRAARPAPAAPPLPRRLPRAHLRHAAPHRTRWSAGLADCSSTTRCSATGPRSTSSLAIGLHRSRRRRPARGTCWKHGRALRPQRRGPLPAVRRRAPSWPGRRRTVRPSRAALDELATVHAWLLRDERLRRERRHPPPARRRRTSRRSPTFSASLMPIRRRRRRRAGGVRARGRRGRSRRRARRLRRRRRAVGSSAASSASRARAQHDRRSPGTASRRHRRRRAAGTRRPRRHGRAAGASAPIARAARGVVPRTRPRTPTRALLTRREVEVLELVAAGRTTARSPRRSEVGESTVVTHVNSARLKLGAQTRMQAASMVIRTRDAMSRPAGAASSTARSRRSSPAPSPIVAGGRPSRSASPGTTVGAVVDSDTTAAAAVLRVVVRGADAAIRLDLPDALGVPRRRCAGSPTSRVAGAAGARSPISGRCSSCSPGVRPPARRPASIGHVAAHRPPPPRRGAGHARRGEQRRGDRPSRCAPDDG